MRKGLTYIDWSISAGLFVLSIIGIFVLFGPSLKQDAPPEYLGEVIKEGIEENYALELTRYPVYAEINTQIAGTETTRYKFIFENVPSAITDPQGEFPQDNQFAVHSAIFTELVEKNKGVGNNNDIEISANFDELGIPINTGTNVETIFYIYASPDLLFFEDSGISLGIDQTDRSPKNVFGVPEIIKGISYQRFNNLTPLNYSDAKTLLNYPKDRDFSIKVYNASYLNQTPILNYTKALPEQNDKVNTLLWSYWLLLNTTHREPITVLIQTW